MRFPVCFLVMAAVLTAGAVPLDWSSSLRGPFPILTVPYAEDGSIDHDVLLKEARFVADAGVNGFIWAQSNDAIDLLTVDERKASFATLAQAFEGKETIVTLGCQGRDMADMAELVRTVERLSSEHPTTRLAVAVRPPHDARSEADLERYYRTLAGIVKRPVIIQTYCSDLVPIPSFKLLIRLARDYPDCFGWIKEETGGDDAIARMRELCKAPEIKTVFSAWGGYAWPYQHRCFGTRGLVTERVAYVDVIMRMWKALEDDDVDLADDIWAKFLLVMNLKETIPGGHLRGFNLHVLCKRGIFKNTLSREYVAKNDISGKWVLKRQDFTARQIEEIERRFSRLKPYLGRDGEKEGK